MEASRCCPDGRRCLRRGSPAPCGTCEIQRGKDPKQTNNKRTNKQTNTNDRTGSANQHNKATAPPARPREHVLWQPRARGDEWMRAIEAESGESSRKISVSAPLQLSVQCSTRTQRLTHGFTPAHTVYKSSFPIGMPMPHAPRSPAAATCHATVSVVCHRSRCRVCHVSFAYVGPKQNQT